MRRRAFILVLAAGCAAPAFAAQPVTDDAITDQVRLRLAADPVVKGGALEVDCKDGVVTLRGRVASEQARERAARLAKRVRGVKAVDSNITLG